jgi:hypothetical protein
MQIEEIGHLKTFQGPYRESNPNPPTLGRSASKKKLHRAPYFILQTNPKLSHLTQDILTGCACGCLSLAHRIFN